MANVIYDDPTNNFTFDASEYTVTDATTGNPASLGDANSVLTITATPSSGYSAANVALTDVDGDGVLNAVAAQPDYWFSTSYLFSGYTFTVGGTEYPAFVRTSYDLLVIVVPESALNNFLNGATVSNVYQASVSDVFLCFAAGTAIATTRGETAVDALRVGDTVRTAEGHDVAVKWIGRQSVAPLFGIPDRLRLVRLARGALGHGLPARDLTLTADHALLIDGLLINAGALVNGASIDYVPQSQTGETYTVYHIETENHDVILAEGTPAETYIDYVARRAFDNYAEYVDLYGEDRTIPELPLPRVSTARMLPAAIKARLSDIKAA